MPEPISATVAFVTAAYSSAVAATATVLGAMGTVGALGMGGTYALAGAIVKGGALLGLSAASAALMRPNIPSSGTTLDFKPDPKAPVRGAMGYTALGGNKVFQATWGYKRVAMSLGVALSLGPIDQVPRFEADGATVSFTGQQNEATGFYAADMWQRTTLGLPGDAALLPPTGLKYGNPGLTGWGTQHAAPQTAFSFWTMVLAKNPEDRDVFTNGVPDPRWIGRWMKVWQPRYDSTYPGGSGPQRRDDWRTWGWSENPYDHALAWVRGHYKLNVDGTIDRTKRIAGIGAPDSAIDIPAFVEGANIADANGWMISGEWSTGDGKFQTLLAMLQAGGGEPISRGAQISVLVNAPRVATYTYTRDDLIGQAEIRPLTPRRERKNTIIPRYKSEANGWQYVPAGEVTSDVYRDEDRGEPRSLEIEYTHVRSAKQAGQLAAYDLANLREGLTATLPSKVHLMHVHPGDCITVDVPELALAGQKFIVRRATTNHQAASVTLELRSESDGKHAWALGQAAQPAPSPSLSAVDPKYVPPPAAEDWTVLPKPPGDGGVSQPIFVIEAPVETTDIVAVIIKHGPSASGPWTDGYEGSPRADGRYEVAGLTPGQTYCVSLQYVAKNGAKSDPSIKCGFVAGDLIAGDTTHLKGEPVQDILDKLTDTADLADQNRQAVEALEEVYGDTASAATSAAAAAASEAAAVQAKADALIAKGEAQDARDEAAQKVLDAAGSAAASAGSATAADNARAAAVIAKGEAQTARDTAATKATEAAGSAAAALTSKNDAAASATTVTQKATDAAGSAATATQQAGLAAGSATAAGGSATAASGSASTAATKANEAGNSATAANAAKVAAESARDTADQKATAAASSAASAATSSTQAGQSASAAQTAKTDAETARAQAQTFRNEAADSATNAAGSAATASSAASQSVTAKDQAQGFATAANTSAQNAAGSATAAGNSATAANASKVAAESARDTADQKATAAASSAASAATSSTQAGQSASAAQTAKTDAETARAQAQTSASNAADAVTNAAGSAATATQQAGLATTARNDAAGSASAALTSRNQASGFATAAETAAAASSASSVTATTASSNAQGVADRLMPDRVSQVTDFSLVGTGQPSALPNLASPSQGSVVSVTGEGDVWQTTLASNLYSKGWRPVEDGRTYAMTVRQRVTVDGPGNFTSIFMHVLDSAGATLGQLSLAAPKLQVSQGWVQTRVERTAAQIRAAYPNAAFIRSRVQPNRGTLSPSGATTQFSVLRLEDATQEVTARGHASAAATSAASAAASETAAGQSASAASTAKTQAETARGQAQTAATQASSSRDDAAGSAASASSSATNAANSRDAAAGSASAAAGSASTASTKANEAGISAASALSSQVSASTARDEAMLALLQQGRTNLVRRTRATAGQVVTTSEGLSGWGFSMVGTGSGSQERSIAVGPLKQNTPYSLSFMARRLAGSGSKPITFDLFPDTLPERAFDIQSNVWTRYTWENFSSAHADMTLSSVRARFFRPNMEANVNVEIAAVKIEEGATATVWTPSPFDAADSASAAATSASSAAASETAAGQSATAASGSATTAATKAGQAQTYSNQASSSASAAAGSANTASQASGTAVTAKNDAVSAKDAAQGAAATAIAQASSASASAASAQISADLVASVNNQSGFNILPNSTFAEGFAGWSSSSWLYTTTAPVGPHAYVNLNGTNGLDSDYISINASLTYVLSADFRRLATSGNVVVDLACYGNTGGVLGYSSRAFVNTNTNFGEGARRFVKITSFPAGTKRVRVRVFGENLTGIQTNGAGVRQIKLEVGDSMTAWRDDSQLIAVDARASLALSTSVDAVTRLGQSAFELILAAGGSPAYIKALAGAGGSEIALAATELLLRNVVGDQIVTALKLVNGEAYFGAPVSVDISGRRLTIGPGFGVSSGLVLWFGPNSVALSAMSRTNGYFAMGTDGKVYYGSAELSGGGGFHAQASAASRIGTRTTAGSVTTATVTITTTGATGSVSYDWSQIGGEETWTITAPSGPETAFRVNVSSPGEIKRAQFACLVRDAGSGRAFTIPVGAAAIFNV